MRYHQSRQNSTVELFIDNHSVLCHPQLAVKFNINRLSAIRKAD